MKKFKCYALHSIMKYDAPWMLVFASNKEDAIKQAKQNSRLSDFPNDWEFHGFEITR